MIKQSKPKIERVFPKILPEIRSLIEVSRHHAAVTANLALVNLYWNIGRIITEDIQKNKKRAGYGEQLVEELGRALTREYGQGFSARNLWDMKRFCTEFQILQPLTAEFDSGHICQTVSIKFRNNRILQTSSGESSDLNLRNTPRPFVE